MASIFKRQYEKRLSGCCALSSSLQCAIWCRLRPFFTSIPPKGPLGILQGCLRWGPLRWLTRHPPPHPPSSRVNQRLCPSRLTQLSKKAAALIEVLWQVTSLAVGIRERLGGMPADKRGLLTALNVFSRLKSVFYQGLVKLSSSLLVGDSLVCSEKKKNITAPFSSLVFL